jgi:hypothetical protein
MLSLVVRGLACWRLSDVLVNEDGPWNMSQRIREWSGIEYGWNNEKMMVVSRPSWSPLHCIYCTSVWVGLLLAVLPWRISLPLALSGVAALIEDVLELGRS